MSMRAAVAALAIAAGGVGLPLQAGFAGNWTVTFDTPQGARDAAVAITVDGTAINGNTSSVASRLRRRTARSRLRRNGEGTGDQMNGSWG